MTQFRDAGAWTKVKHLIRIHADELLAQDRWQTLYDWFEGVSRAVWKTAPICCIGMVWR